MHLTFLAYDGQNQNADARVRMALTVRDAERWDAFAAAMGNTLETTSIEATDGTSAVTIAGRTPAHHWFNLGTDDATDQPTDERGTTATSSSLYATLIKHGKVISLASGDATNEGLNVAGSGRSGSVLDFIEVLHGHPTYRWLEWALEPTGHPGHLSFTGRIALRTQDPPAPIDVRDVPWAEPSQVSAPTKTAATPPQHLHVRAWADGPQASVLLVNTQTNQSLLAVGRNHSQEADAILLELQPHYASVELNGTVHILDLP